MVAKGIKKDCKPKRGIKIGLDRGGVTGTVTTYSRELRGSGSFMDIDPAKGGAALNPAYCGAMGSLGYGSGWQKWHSGPALTSFVTLTRARGPGRGYGVARQRDRSRQNSTGVSGVLLSGISGSRVVPKNLARRV